MSAGTRVRIDVFGDTVIDRRMLGIASRGNDSSPAWAGVAAYLEELEDRQFATEGRELSGGWAPLAPSTLRSKPSGLRVLERTGALGKSLGSARGPGAIREVRPDGLDFGTSDPKAIFHHRGTRNMPRRPLLEVREGHARHVIKIVHRFVVEGS